MSQATQNKRFGRIDTPLGNDVLLLRGFTMQDRLSESFHIDVDLLSENGQVQFDSIVGKAVTLQIDVGESDKRYFNGVVATFSQVSSEGQLSAYHAVVVPSFWLLTLSSHCRIYQNERVPDILKKIFQAANVEVDDRLHGTYQAKEFCVQYRETDFNFCNRLMEQEGIYYFFKHEQGKHTLVMADSKAAHEPFPGHASIDFRPYTSDTPNAKFIRHWSTSKSVESSRYAHTDFDFEKPKNDLFHREQSPHPSSGQPLEIYDYPGLYKQTSTGEQLGKVRMGEIDAEGLTKHGVSDCPGVAVGCRFQLGRCPRVSFPRDDDYREYLVTSAVYSVRLQDFETERSSNHRPYECSFTVIPQDAQFRPPRVTPKPHVQGPQTAMVVGPAGQEIHTDKYGRIKVQFHWDRDGKRDEKSSCFIRVAQGWAGKNWGAIMIPRIGHEVVVDFLEGDPDRPLITGSVYNAETMPPYPLDAKAAISGVKTNSTKGGGGYNEFSMDDTKGSELITTHAQRDMESKIEHDRRTTVVNNDDLHITTGNQTTKIDTGKSQTEAMQSIELKVGQNRILIDQSGITIEGITLKFTGQASAAIEAAMTEVTGNGMLKLKGGIAMIN
jgi:type VI secretion system secreted protein VgrG